MEYMRNFKWPKCPMYLWNLHFSIVSIARHAWFIFVEKPRMKKNSFQNGETDIDQTKVLKGIVVNQNWNYVYSHFKTLNWFYINLLLCRVVNFEEMNKMELSFPTNSDFLIPLFFSTWWCKPLIFQT